MKMLSGCVVVLFLHFLAASGVFAQSAHDGSTAASKGTVPTGTRTLRIAIVQMSSLDHDIDGNLKRATQFAEKAVRKAQSSSSIRSSCRQALISLSILGIQQNRAMARPSNG